jgi:hypothetical protein
MWGWITAILKGLIQPFLDKWIAVRHGEKRQQLKQAEDTLDAVGKADDIDRRLRSDPDYRKRVRSKSYRD